MNAIYSVCGIKKEDLSINIDLDALFTALKNSYSMCLSENLTNKPFHDFHVLPEAPIEVLWGNGPDFDAAAPMPEYKKGIRVLTLCTTLHGGAGEGSFRRVKALRKLGVDARLVGIHTRREEHFAGRLIPAVAGCNAYQCEPFFSNLMAKISLARRPSFQGHEHFPNALSAIDFRQLARLTDWADIVHLHWVDGMLDYAHMPEVLGKKPVVWTMSSMNPFTGGCHYSEGCQEFTAQCKACPQFTGEDSQLPHQTWKLREEVYKKLNLTMISPAPHIAAMAKCSSLLRDIPLYVIPNAYPSDYFLALDRHEARKYLNLPQERPILLFGAVGLHLARKGKKQLTDALACLKKSDPETAAKILVVSFGHDAFECCCDVYHMGYVPQTCMPLLYSAANATAVPSLEDMGPMTIGESLLCGTPVVGFSSLSLLSILGKHGEGVYIADAFNINDFAKGILWTMKKKFDIQERVSIRKYALNLCSPVLSAYLHKKLYTKLLGIKNEESAHEIHKSFDMIDTFSSSETKKFIDFMPYTSASDSSKAMRHWVMRRDNRENNCNLFYGIKNFDTFTYARRSHMEKLIQGYIINPDGSEVNIDTCDLKAYQDGLCAAFIEQMFPHQTVKILEIGGAHSRVLAHYARNKLYECWNLDKFKGVGNGPTNIPPSPPYTLVQDYIGNFSKELPDNYFDLVFSSSVLEHVDEDEKNFCNIYNDITRVLKSGGYSLHLIDFGLKSDRSDFHGIVRYLFTVAPTLNCFVEPQNYPYYSDIYYMSRYRYDWRWKPVLKIRYEEFGKPTSINIVWKK